MTYLHRNISDFVECAAHYFPVVVVTGPRQSGKSTLCRHLFGAYAHYSLEDLALREHVEADPNAFLEACGQTAVIDEVQHVPALFSYIRVLVDREPGRRFVLTGSSNFELMDKITQSLAGRAALFTLLPMALDEAAGYDTGLLCFLLGIETQEQLAVHPLRGNVFENLAVTELVKKRLNAGKLPNLCFYRENKGREADIVCQEGDRLDLFEVKSSRAFVRNLDYLRDILGDAVRSATVVYDGDPLPPTAINIRRLAALF